MSDKLAFPQSPLKSQSQTLKGSQIWNWAHQLKYRKKSLKVPGKGESYHFTILITVLNDDYQILLQI